LPRSKPIRKPARAIRGGSVRKRPRRGVRPSCPSAGLCCERRCTRLLGPFNPRFRGAGVCKRCSVSSSQVPVTSPGSSQPAARVCHTRRAADLRCSSTISLRSFSAGYWSRCLAPAVSSRSAHQLTDTSPRSPGEMFPGSGGRRDRDLNRQVP
jgi:hypothetical protein